MRVLIACEYSGVVRRAFAARGHLAFSCDFEEAEDGAAMHYRGDVRDLLADDWDLMIAHPPCTFLSVSGMHRTTRGLRPMSATDEAVEFARLLLNAPIERIAVENPVGVLSTRIRKPEQIIQPYQFGHDASKKTCLWLKNLPLLQPTKFVEPRMVCIGDGGRDLPRWANQTDSGQNRLSPGPDRWRDRSRTYEGIAAAMAEQWG